MKKQQGFSLVEIIISSVIGIFLLGGALAVYVAMVKSNTDNMQRIYLAQDLRTTFSLMSRDVKRAGFWPNSSIISHSNTNLSLSSTSTGVATLTDADGSGIFAELGNDVAGLVLAGLNGRASILSYVDSNNVQVKITEAFDSSDLSQGNWTVLNPYTLVFPTNGTATDCVLLTYDRDDDNTIDANEQIGYRLQNGKIQMYQSGTFACDSGTWEDVSDTTTTITNLQFLLDQDFVDIDDAGPGTSQMLSQKLTISVNAQLSNDANVTAALNETLYLQNNQFLPG